MLSASRHLLQISGPSQLPDPIVRAMNTPVIIYPASGAGECKATLINAATDCSVVAISTR